MFFIRNGVYCLLIVWIHNIYLKKQYENMIVFHIIYQKATDF